MNTNEHESEALGRLNRVASLAMTRVADDVIASRQQAAKRVAWMERSGIREAVVHQNADPGFRCAPSGLRKVNPENFVRSGYSRQSRKGEAQGSAEQ